MKPPRAPIDVADFYLRHARTRKVNGSLCVCVCIFCHIVVHIFAVQFCITFYINWI